MTLGARSSRSFLGPWVALTGSLAFHVADEALTGFLELWNPLVLRARSRFPWSPLPTFEFGVWLGGLILGVIVLFALSPRAAAGARWLRFLAYPYAVLMLLNGLGHVAASLYLERLAPGVSSSPLLVASSLWLLARLRGTGAKAGAGTGASRLASL